MKYTISFKRTLGRRSGLILAALVALSIACNGANSGNTSGPQPANAQGTPAPSKSQSAVTNVAANQPVDGTETNAKPSIEITEVPRKGAGEQELETIAGRVGGVKISECKVVLFAGTDQWYVQPYIASPDTEIKEDNTWRNDTHLGSRYAALLVKNSYHPPSTTGKLPEVGGQVLAITTVNARQ
jgi:hypothetical protein